MPRRRLIAGILVLSVLSLATVPTAEALFPDPWKIYLLTRIARTLNQIYKVVHKINAATKAIRDRNDEMFPNRTLDEIRSGFGQVRSIQDEITDLSCNWRFSPRILGFHRGLLKLGPLCRNEYQRVFGAPLIGVDADLEEYRQWQATLRWNMVADTIAASHRWTTVAGELAREARHAGNTEDPNSPYSVGYSQRLLAVTEALGLQIDARENALQAVQLAALQEELDLERREDLHVKTASLLLLSSLKKAKPPRALSEILSR